MLVVDSKANISGWHNDTQASSFKDEDFRSNKEEDWKLQRPKMQKQHQQKWKMQRDREREQARQRIRTERWQCNLI